MMATLAFENDCVLLCDAASMSIQRYAACQPWTLFPPILRGARVSRNFGVVMLVALLSIVMLLTQLLSAVLLVDLDQDYVRGPQFNEIYSRQVGDAYFDMVKAASLAERPLSFPRFAEQTGRSLFISENATGRGLRDTGVTLRAFPDLGNASTRSSLLYYHGRGGVAEAHVLCVSPDLDNLTYTKPRRVSGKLSSAFLYKYTNQPESERSFRWNASQPSSDLVFNFNCTLGGNWGFALCPLKPLVQHDCPGFPTECLLSSTNAWFLIIKDYAALWKFEETDYHPKLADAISQLYNKDGYEYYGTEWIRKTVELGSSAARLHRRQQSEAELGLSVTHLGGPPFSLPDDTTRTPDYTTRTNYTTQMSLCVVAAGNTMASIEAQAVWRADEPVLGFEWDSNVSPTDAIRKQLSSGSDFGKRGVMNLTTYTIEGSQPFTRVINQTHGIFGNYSQELPQLNEVYRSLVTEHMDSSTSSIAFGLQTLFTVLTSKDFYDELAIPEALWRRMFQLDDLGANSTWGVKLQNITRTIQRAGLAQVPVRNIGLNIAFGILGLHIVSMIIVSWLYITCNAPKFLDQAWHTVGQLHRGDANDFLDETGDKGDREVACLQGVAKHWEKVVKITESKIAFKELDTEPLLSM